MQKFNFHPTYKGLLKQANALLMILNSKEEQLAFLNRENEELKKYIAANNPDDLRDTIQKLTDLVES